MSNPPNNSLSVHPESPDSFTEQCVEDYLDHLCAPLLGIVPYKQRLRLRREAQDHLLSLIEASEADGVATEEAVRQALREYGEPYQVGQDWVEAWVESESRNCCRIHVADPLTLRAFGWFGVFTVLNLLLLEWQLCWTHHDDLFPLTQLIGVISPFIAGAATGASFHPRASAGICRVVLLLALCSGMIGLQFLPRWDGMILALSQCAYWLPIGCLSAVVTAYLRRQFRIQRHRTQVC